jgi:hypothetical protein
LSDTPSLTPSLTVTAQEAISALIRANGSMDLAAERLHLPKEELVALLCEDPQDKFTLTQRLNTLLQLQAFSILVEVGVVFKAILPELEPADVAKAHAQLLQSYTQLTSLNDQPLSRGELHNIARKLAEERGLDGDDAVAAIEFAEDQLRQTRALGNLNQPQKSPFPSFPQPKNDNY